MQYLLYYLKLFWFDSNSSFCCQIPFFLGKKYQKFSHFMYLFWLENSKPCDKSVGVYTPSQQPKPKPNHWLILLGVLNSISGLTWKLSRTQWKWKWHASWCSRSVSLSTGVTIKTRNVMSRGQDKNSVNAKKGAQSGLSIRPKSVSPTSVSQGWAKVWGTIPLANHVTLQVQKWFAYFQHLSVSHLSTTVSFSSLLLSLPPSLLLFSLISDKLIDYDSKHVCPHMFEAERAAAFSTLRTCFQCWVLLEWLCGFLLFSLYICCCSRWSVLAKHIHKY